MADAGESLTKIAAAIRTNRRHVRSFLVRHGKVREFPLGSPGIKHPNWKGGKLVDKDGYVLLHCPGHPMARQSQGRYVLAHRLVMAEHLGRMLTDQEVVHHKNDNVQDNRIENLELFASNGRHLSETISGQVPQWSDAGVDRMKEGIARSAKKRQPHTQIESAHDVREWRQK